MPANRAGATRLRAKLLDHALSLPGSYEDHPWGETVVKVNKKVFLFAGSGEGSHPPGISIKLPESRDLALGMPDAEPTGYGLGKAGWVSLKLQSKLPPTEVLLDWVEESYRAVAPKRLITELDEANAS